MNRILTIVLCLVCWLHMQGDTLPACPLVKVQTERLADLNVPRSGHSTLRVGDEVLVVGGHTTGFVPTATAEYYADGQWHLMNMVYTHDDGMALPLSTGQVLIMGGHEKNLGIGQTFEVEMYDPATHTFTGFGCLDQKRVLLSAVEIDSGRVVISGNWYSDDAVEMFDGHKFFTHVKKVSMARCSPFIFRTAKDEVLIISSYGSHANTLDTIVVDRLHGEPFCPPLLRQWRPFTDYCINNSQSASVGDAAKGVYASLLAVEHTETKQIAVALVRDTTITLVPTASAVPTATSFGGHIYYTGRIVVNRQTQRAYLPGFDSDFRFYAMCIEYATLFTKPDALPITLYYTDPMPGCGFELPPQVTADGDLMLTGGSLQADALSDNFAPAASTWLIRVGTGHTPQPVAAAASWPWLLVLLLLVAAAALFWSVHRRHSRKAATPVADIDEPTTEPQGDNPLMTSICELMEQQKVFRNAELKVSDVASALGTNTRYVTECIKASRNQTFSQFVNSYRVSHAQQLLRQNPDIKLTEVSFESGFSNERSFFRTFKTITGMTAREWVQQA